MILELQALSAFKITLSSLFANYLDANLVVAFNSIWFFSRQETHNV